MLFLKEVSIANEPAAMVRFLINSRRFFFQSKKDFSNSGSPEISSANAPFNKFVSGFLAMVSIPRILNHYAVCCRYFPLRNGHDGLHSGSKYIFNIARSCKVIQTMPLKI